MTFQGEAFGLQRIVMASSESLDLSVGEVWEALGVSLPLPEGFVLSWSKIRLENVLTHLLDVHPELASLSLRKLNWQTLEVRASRRQALAWCLKRNEVHFIDAGGIVYPARSARGVDLPWVQGSESFSVPAARWIELWHRSDLSSQIELISLHEGTYGQSIWVRYPLASQGLKAITRIDFGSDLHADWNEKFEDLSRLFHYLKGQGHRVHPILAEQRRTIMARLRSLGK